MRLSKSRKSGQRFCVNDMRQTKDLNRGKRSRSGRALAPFSSHPRHIGPRRATNAIKARAA
ncbi:hypothetical protein GFL93_10630 [Rhizobium leguminosarum bv. viciae]|uniref:Uncharacterized protein n=1 Tax=Rhizobium leguminosarum bv. viciae TaxID=387 RepID=A0A8G2J075_RHILV|nr:hypothetical protein [Rhizobium leguminosarum bv. viciae]TBF82495.1 hypothetical protein ELG86_10285 [Rhizobium leguminosarum]NKK20943.1 hypothetical protein [Rhizobium leguminosarum bv. viciae]NKL55412.1 hypothetical protein [Rhizobium leguminosarum bv. viciae]TBF99055.1 hypothetical protein ELG85_10110 [Rhizobium leguminosarum]